MEWSSEKNCSSKSIPSKGLFRLGDKNQNKIFTEPEVVIMKIYRENSNYVL